MTPIRDSIFRQSASRSIAAKELLQRPAAVIHLVTTRASQEGEPSGFRATWEEEPDAA